MPRIAIYQGPPSACFGVLFGCHPVGWIEAPEGSHVRPGPSGALALVLLEPEDDQGKGWAETGLADEEHVFPKPLYLAAEYARSLAKSRRFGLSWIEADGAGEPTAVERRPDVVMAGTAN